MKQPRIAPYGSWQSPIRAERIARGTIGLEDVLIEVDSCSSIHVVLPRTAGFRKADLSRESAKELEKVEK